MASVVGMQTKAPTPRQDSDQDKGEFTTTSVPLPLSQGPLEAALMECDDVGGANMKDFCGTTHEDLGAQVVTWGAEHTQTAEFQNLNDFMLTFNFPPDAKDPGPWGDLFS